MGSPDQHSSPTKHTPAVLFFQNRSFQLKRLGFAGGRPRERRGLAAVACPDHHLNDFLVHVGLPCLRNCARTTTLSPSSPAVPSPTRTNTDRLPQLSLPTAPGDSEFFFGLLIGCVSVEHDLGRVYIFSIASWTAGTCILTCSMIGLSPVHCNWMSDLEFRRTVVESVAYALTCPDAVRIKLCVLLSFWILRQLS